MLAGGFVITLCLLSLCFMLCLCWLGANRRLIGVNQIVCNLQLSSLMMQWDDFMFNSIKPQTVHILACLCGYSTLQGSCSGAMLTWHLWLDGGCHAEEPGSLQRTPLLCSAALCAPCQGRLHCFALSSSFYFQAQNCLQLPFLKQRQLYMSKKCFCVQKCLLWCVVNSEVQQNSQRDYSFKPKYLFLHIVHQLASRYCQTINSFMSSRCLGLFGRL